MKRVRIDELIVHDEAGFACSKSKLVETGLPHLRPFNISDDGGLDLTQIYLVPPSEAPKGKAQLLAGDILFNNTNSADLVGKSTVVKEPMVAGFSNHLTRVRVDKDRVEPLWFGFWLRRLRSTGYFTANATQWVSQAAYRTADLRKLELELPFLDEQRRIVDLLSRAEGIVRLRREAQKKTADIIPALFLDMFGDPATNPKGWPVAPLGDHIDFLTGFAFKSSEFVAEGASLKLCRGANVLPQCVDWSDVRYWPNERVDDLRRFMLVEGDIVLAMDRPWISTGLKVARMTKNDVPALLVQRVARIRPKDTLIHEYVYAALCHERFTAHCNVVKTETLVPHISPHDIRSFPLVLAPIAQQQRFATFVEQVQSIASQQSEVLAKAEATFNALLGRMFSVAVGSTASNHKVEAASV